MPNNNKASSLQLDLLLVILPVTGARTTCLRKRGAGKNNRTAAQPTAQLGEKTTSQAQPARIIGRR